MRSMSRGWCLSCAVVLSGTLVACAPQRPLQYPSPNYPNAPVVSQPGYPSPSVGIEVGRLVQIDVLQGAAPAQTSGAGAVLGAVVGGVLGNQIGKGSGRAAATAVGVLGGAVAGNAIEGRRSGDVGSAIYRLSIQLDHGGYRYYDVSSPGDLRVGDRVRIDNGQISRF